MPEPFVLRAPRDADVAAIVALFNAGSRETGVEPTESPADVLRRWEHPRLDRALHDRVAEIDGRVVAHAGMWFEGAIAVGGGYVLPGERGRGIGHALVDFLVATARATPDARELHLWTDVQVAGAIDLYEQTPGAEYARTFIRMINREPAAVAPPEWPDGIRLASLKDDELLDAVIAAHDGSFVDHWGFEPADRDDCAHELAHPEEDPALWFVATAGDEIAGFNLCHLRRAGTFVRGYLGPIGTTRPFRQRGLARALLRHGVREMAARGATEIMLGVDAENPNQALGLYERNGFERWSEGRVYRVKL